ncbi:hypothetical protein [Vibrio vulnificus]|uniref:hypothetical protein n=1 Tax=Vibrio vulnificus TaxID=672 RepID=UPI0015931BAD|nr:hypothetical protein [Vibrio vulnificus]NVC72613.1 hypothetical protein [Vibrio vulnificus]
MKDVSQLNDTALEQEFEGILPLISQYLPIYLEKKKREVVGTILVLDDAQDVMGHKKIYNYLNGLQGEVANQLEDSGASGFMSSDLEGIE